MIRPFLLAACTLAFSAADADEPPEVTRSRETCPAGAFPTSIEEISVRPRLQLPSDAERRRDTGTRWAPEIHELKLGISHTLVGASINDGWSMWRAIDFDRRIAIDIESNSGRQLILNPELLTYDERPGTFRRVRHPSEPGPAVDVIRIVPMSGLELRDAACLANRIVVLHQVAKQLKLAAAPLGRRNPDIHESNMVLVVGPGQLIYDVVDANRVEHDQLRSLLDAKFAKPR